VVLVARSSNTNEYTYQWNVEDDEPTLKITKSSFGSFQWCPKKYEFSYIERLPQDTSEAMIKGTVVHNSREDFFDVLHMRRFGVLGLSSFVMVAAVERIRYFWGRF